MTEDKTATVPVQERHQFDLNKLSRYLVEHVKDLGNEIKVEEFAGGQSNPTFLLTSGNNRYVMRRKPPGKLLNSAHAVDREYRVLQALGGTDVPVPKVHVLCDDESVIGSWFYVMDYKDGRIFENLFGDRLQPQERRQIWDAAIVAQAKLHNVDFEAVGLSDYGKQAGYIPRQLKLWSNQYEYTRTAENPYMDKLIEWLPMHVPTQDRCCIVHGDYKFNNIMMDPKRSQVLAILDWELSTLGDPLSDFAYFCMVYRDELRDSNIRALGLYSEAETIDRYCQLTNRDGIDPEQWSYYLAFNLFRLAAIFQGIARRVLDGTAKSDQSGSAEERAIELSRLAWQQTKTQR